MPTLTKNGVRHCPKCEQPFSKKSTCFQLLLCPPCIKWEANRKKREQRLDRRLQNGNGLTPFLLRFQQTSAPPDLQGPATLKLDDLPPQARRHIAGIDFSVEQLEALCKPYGHAVYSMQLRAEKDGQPFRHTDGAMGATSGGSQPLNCRDSVMDPSNANSDSQYRSTTSPLHRHASHEKLESSTRNPWSKAQSRPCINCVKEDTNRAANHPLAHCPFIKMMHRRIVHYRLCQEGVEIETAQDDSEEDETMKSWRAQNSILGGTGHKKDKKHGEVRASFGNCAQTPCLACSKRCLNKRAKEHCLLDCDDVQDDHLLNAQKKFQDAIDWVNQLVYDSTATPIASFDDQETESDFERQQGVEKHTPRQEMASPVEFGRQETGQQETSEMQTAKKEMEAHDTNVPVDQGTEAEDWRIQVLSEILNMELAARPGTPLQVALAVRRGLEQRLMDDVTNEAAAHEGTPISIPLLEVLKHYIEMLE